MRTVIVILQADVGEPASDAGERQQGPSPVCGAAHRDNCKQPGKQSF